MHSRVTALLLLTFAAASASALQRQAYPPLRSDASFLQQNYRLSDAEWRRVVNLTPADVIEAVTVDPDYSHLVHASLWLRTHPDFAAEIVVQLPALLRDNTCIGLTNSADLIIWDRIQTGELTFWGHGGGSDDDLFQVSGRASWLLKELTGQDFGAIRMNTTTAERAALAEKWSRWFQTRLAGFF
jgi:hypothetical protein